MLAACQTTCMAYHQAFWVVARTAAVAPPYHEAFWVVVGTAGPVVALAAVVAWAQVNTQIERFQQNPNQLPPAFYLYFLVWMLLLVCIMIETGAFGLSLAILLDRRETAREQLWGLFIAIGGLCVMWGASLWFGLVRIAERADAIANKSAPVLASGSNASEQSAEVSLEHESKRAEQQPEQEAKPAEQPNGKSPQDQPRSKHTGIAGGLLVVGIALGYTASRLRWLHRSGRPVRRQR